MNRRLSLTAILLLVLITALVALSGCPLDFKPEDETNQTPLTFFLGDPPDTTFRNEIFFNWNGTDLDSDVVAYQFQLVSVDSAYNFSGGLAGNVIESIDPRGGPEVRWSSRTTDDSRVFADLDDGFYEMRVRAIDSRNNVDDNPARHLFFVFYDDIVPEPEIIDPADEVVRLEGQPEIDFTFTARDFSRNSESPRATLEYSYQLRASSTVLCSSHLSDAATAWKKFPSGGELVTVGGEPPTQYTDLLSCSCDWVFTLQVRDAAGNIGRKTRLIKQQPCP